MLFASALHLLLRRAYLLYCLERAVIGTSPSAGSWFDSCDVYISKMLSAVL